MSRGYVIQADTDPELYQAELLANSIKIKNKNAQVCLVTSRNLEADAFDDIVKYEFFMHEEVVDIRQKDWQLYWCSPYEYTIAIDCKSVVMESHDNLWEYLIDNHSVCLPTVVKDFRNNTLVDKQLSKYEQEYKYKKAYGNCFYFDKSEESLEYFKFLDPLCRDWRSTEGFLFQKQHANKKYYSNLIHTIAANSMRFDVFPTSNDMLSYIDMDIAWIDGILPDGENWLDVMSVWSTDIATLKIQNYSINNILYYHEDSFYNNEIADDFRNYRETINK